MIVQHQQQRSAAFSVTIFVSAKNFRPQNFWPKIFRPNFFQLKIFEKFCENSLRRSGYFFDKIFVNNIFRKTKFVAAAAELRVFSVPQPPPWLQPCRLEKGGWGPARWGPAKKKGTNLKKYSLCILYRALITCTWPKGPNYPYRDPNYPYRRGPNCPYRRVSN